MHVINWRQHALPNLVGALLFATSHLQHVLQPHGRKNKDVAPVTFDVRWLGNMMITCMAA